MEVVREYLERYVPGVVIDAALLCVVLVVAMLFVKYNIHILKAVTHLFGKLNSLLGRVIGKFSKNMNKSLYRQSVTDSGKRVSKIYNYFDGMITDMDLRREGVTVFGLVSFLAGITLLFTIVLSVVFKLGFFSIFAYVAVFYVVFTMFRLIVSSKVAHREELIMDTIDLLVPDLRDGVYNAICRYKDTAINPEIAGYFQEFVYNITNNGWTFQQAMQDLNRSLGPTFSDFASKAILYEANRDEDTLEIFSATVDMNSNKRMLRMENNRIFGQVRLAFWLCLLLIVGSAILFCLFDNAVAYVFMGTPWGRIMIIIDIFIVAHTISKISLLQNGKF